MKNFLFRVLTKDKTQGYVGLVTNINSQTDLFWSVDELGFNPYDVEFKETTFGGISLPVNIVIEEDDDDEYGYIDEQEGVSFNEATSFDLTDEEQEQFFKLDSNGSYYDLANGCVEFEKWVMKNMVEVW